MNFSPRATVTAAVIAGVVAQSASAAPMPAPPKADPDMQMVLDELGALGGKPIEDLSPAEARRQPSPADAVKALMVKQGKSAPQDVSTRDLSVMGAAGPLQARMYTPSGGAQAKSLVVYFHGGGWVIANIDVYDASIRAIARESGAVVLAANYRKGPEFKFPAAHDDAFAVYQWAIENAQSLGVDAASIAVAGESAGGNLATHVSIRARDAGIQAPVHQLLIYPVAGADMQTESYQNNVDAKPLNKAMMQWFVEHALPATKDAKDARINLVTAKLSGLPPTTLITAEIDPLQSEGLTLGKKLELAGTKVSARDFSGATHEFFGMDAVVADAKEAQKFAGRQLRSAFAESSK